MTPTTYQTPEIRDSNDNIIKQGSFGKNTALANSTNDGWIDYVANDLEFLYGLAKDEVVPVSELPSAGDTNKTYLLTTTGVCYRWSGTEWVAVSSSEAVGRAETAASLAEQWATKTSGTVDGTEYSAKYYAEQAQDTADDLSESLEQIATNTANIEENAENIATNTGNIAQNTTDIDIAEKRIGNIEKLLQGNLYDYQTDTDSKYTKTVLAGAMPYASLDSIGGKTLVWNQLNNNSASTATNYGVTLTNNQDGSWTVNNTATGDFPKSIGQINLVKGHKYYIGGCPSGGSDSTFYLSLQSYGKDYGDGAILSWTSTTQSRWLQLFYANGVTFNNVTFYPIVRDLTLMFGSGNEPSTVAEYKAIFPNDTDVTFTQGQLLSAGVTEVVSKKADTTTIATYPIPAEIQALEGYGWSAGSVYNYIDYDRKVFVQRVGAVDLGTVDFSALSTPANHVFRSGLSNIPNIKNPPSNDDIPNIINVVYTVKDYHTISASDNLCMAVSGDASNRIVLVNQAYSTVESFVSAMSGVYLYYELATPVEVDISQYLTDDNLISVESGGTLTFPNSNGTDYQIPVPSAETYMVDLQASL